MLRVLEGGEERCRMGGATVEGRASERLKIPSPSVATTWRIEVPDSSGGLEISRWNGISTTWINHFVFSTSGHTSYEDLTLDKSDPTLTFDTGGTNDYSVTSNGSRLQFTEGSSSLLELTGSGHTSYEDLTIETSAPTITFTDTDAADFKARVNAGRFDVTNASGFQFFGVAGSTSVFSLYKVTSSANEQFRIDPRDINADCHVEVGLGDDTRGKVGILRDQRNGQERMGVLVLQDLDGTDWYIWVNRNGGGTNQKLMMDSTDPGTNEAPASALTVGP